MFNTHIVTEHKRYWYFLIQILNNIFQHIFFEYVCTMYLYDFIVEEYNTCFYRCLSLYDDNVKDLSRTIFEIDFILEYWRTVAFSGCKLFTFYQRLSSPKYIMKVYTIFKFIRISDHCRFKKTPSLLRPRLESFMFQKILNLPN